MAVQRHEAGHALCYGRRWADGRRPDGARLLVAGGGRRDPEVVRVKHLVKQCQAETEGYAVPREQWDSLQGTKAKRGAISPMIYVLEKAGISIR